MFCKQISSFYVQYLSTAPLLWNLLLLNKREDRIILSSWVEEQGSKALLSMTTWFIVLILVNTSGSNTVPLFKKW